MLKKAMLAAVAIAPFWASIAAQQPAPQNGVVRGRVIATDGAPLPRTRVILSRSGSGGFTGDTNPNGDYEIRDVTPGSYEVLADRPGYLQGSYTGGADPSPGVQPRIRVEAGRTVEHADLRLAFGGVINGRVLDEKGRPLSARVTALDAAALRREGMKLRASSDRRELDRFFNSDSKADTNHLGRFRITDLQPGAYILRVTVFENEMSDKPDDEAYAYATTYFPGVFDAEQAAPISVDAGAQVDGIDVPVLTVLRVAPRIPVPRFSNGPMGNSSVSGTVTRPDGLPVRSAYVHLVVRTSGDGLSTAPNRSAATDAAGRFRIDRLPAGRYEIVIGNAGGYSLTHAGKRRPEDPGLGTVVEVRDGENVRNLRLTITPGASLSGRVTDPQGRPVPGVRLTALEARYVEGEPVRDIALSVTSAPGTDALGEFRIDGLRPGRYYLLAVADESWPGSAPDETLIFHSTYYPGVPYELAQAVDVAAGQEAVLNFSLNEGPVTRVTGRVMSATGAPSGGVTVRFEAAVRGVRALLNTPSQTNLIRFASTAPDGTFDMTVPAGDYLLSTASVSREFVTVPPTAAFAIDVVERGSAAISGSIVMDDGRVPPFSSDGLEIDAAYRSDFDRSPAPSSGAVFPDWSFSVLNLQRPAALRLNGLPDGYAVSKIRRDGADVTDRVIDTGNADVEGIEFVVTNRTGQVSGTVTDGRQAGANRTVVVFAEDRSRWGAGARFVRAAFTDERGAFSLRGVLPGFYRVAAPRTVLPGQWENADFLRSIAASSVLINVAAGASVGDLRLAVRP